MIPRLLFRSLAIITDFSHIFTILIKHSKIVLFAGFKMKKNCNIYWYIFILRQIRFFGIDNTSMITSMKKIREPNTMIGKEKKHLHHVSHFSVCLFKQYIHWNLCLNCIFFFFDSHLLHFLAILDLDNIILTAVKMTFSLYQRTSSRKYIHIHMHRLYMRFYFFAYITKGWHFQILYKTVWGIAYLCIWPTRSWTSEFVVLILKLFVYR